MLIQIKKEKDVSYDNIAIHLDLAQSEQISEINEFLFSFLITKFYYINEDVIYIPKDIDIYIEIQNNFTNNYLSKFRILNVFEKFNIELNNIPKLDLSKEIADDFKIKFRLDSNEKIEQFIKNNIGIEKYTFHQVNIFIQIFISQFDFFKTVFKIIRRDGQDETEKYIKKFAKVTQYFTKVYFSKLFINKNNIQRNYTNVLLEMNYNDLDCINFKIPLFFIVKERKIFLELELKKKNINYQESLKDNLKIIKQMINLKNEVDININEKKSLISILDYQSEHYIIINDTYKKMILLLYRIKINMPFIIMGETGCGKTLLITKLNQIINNGEILLEKINFYPDITEQIICEEMKRINNKYLNSKEEIWVFFDDINTCQLLDLINEIFLNRTFLGEKLNENIRLMGGCNPYRKRKI